MCQYNLIIIDKKYDDSFLMKTGYRRFDQHTINGNAYCKKPCDCGSFVSAQKEFQDISYQEFINIEKEKKVDELLRIKELLKMPDYNEQYEEYSKFSDYAFEELMGYYDKFDNLTPELELSLSNTDEYKRITELSSKMNEMDMKYLRSRNYTLNNSSDSIVEYRQYGEKCSEDEIHRKPIDDAIEVCKQEENLEGYQEYDELYKLFIALLEVVPCFGFLTVWISIDENKRTSNRVIPINNLSIEDLAKLEHNCKIVITR